MNDSLYWLFGLLQSNPPELRALRLVIDGALNDDIKANPGATDDGKGIMECLAYACRDEVFKTLKTQKSRDYSWYHNGDPDDFKSWEYAPNADVVFLEMVRFGVDPWKPWKVPVSKFNPAGELDGFDLACALGSQPLARACLEHPNCPPVETLHSRLGWRMGQPFNEGSSWKKVLTAKDSLVTVASAQGSWGLVQLLLEKGWPVNPSVGVHPLAVAQTEKLLEVMAPFLGSDGVPEGVVNKWAVLAKGHKEGAETLSARTKWVMSRSHSNEARESLTKRAFELWKSSGEEAEFSRVLSALGLPKPPPGPLNEEQRLEYSRQKGLMWAKMPDMLLSSGGFAQLGKMPMWWCLCNLALNSTSHKIKTQTSVFWVGSISLEHPELSCSLPGVNLTARGAAALLAQRSLVASSSNSKMLAKVMDDLGWSKPELRSQLTGEAADAVRAWHTWGTNTQKVKSKEAFECLVRSWSKDMDLPEWNSPCWSKLLPVFQILGFDKEFAGALRPMVEQAPLDWAIKWLQPLAIKPPVGQSKELMDYVCARMADEKWDASAIAEWVRIVASPSSLPVVLGEQRWGTLTSLARSHALDQAWELAPDRPKVKL